MPRTIWKGSISFGLVNIPIALYPGEQRDELHFTLLDSRDMSPVGYKRINKRTGGEVAWEQIVKGYEYDKDQYVVLGEEEFRRANVKATQTIDIMDFVKAGEVPFLYFDRPYYLEPVQRTGEKGYALLRETLKRTGRVGIASVVLRNRQHLAMVAPYRQILTLNLLRFHNELRDSQAVKAPGEDLAALRITKREIEMAERLVQDMAARWEPEKYKDEYRDDLLRVVEEKVAAGKTLELEAPAAGETPGTGQVIDFMTLLKRSVEEKEKERGQQKQTPRAAATKAARAARKKTAAQARRRQRQRA
ncbi:MAG: Ku protein [Gammaproteobacteria bacterium]